MGKLLTRRMVLMGNPLGPSLLSLRKTMRDLLHALSASPKTINEEGGEEIFTVDPDLVMFEIFQTQKFAQFERDVLAGAEFPPVNLSAYTFDSITYYTVNDGNHRAAAIESMGWKHSTPLQAQIRSYSDLSDVTYHIDNKSLLLLETSDGYSIVTNKLIGPVEKYILSYLYSSEDKSDAQQKRKEEARHETWERQE